MYMSTKVRNRYRNIVSYVETVKMMELLAHLTTLMDETKLSLLLAYGHLIYWKVQANRAIYKQTNGRVVARTHI